MLFLIHFTKIISVILGSHYSFVQWKSRFGIFHIHLPTKTTKKGGGRWGQEEFPRLRIMAHSSNCEDTNQFFLSIKHQS